MQRHVGVPFLGTAVTIDLVDLDPDAEVVRPEELNRPAAVVQVGLHHQRIVIRLALQFVGQRPGLVRRFEFAPARGDGQVDLPVRRCCRLLSFPFFEQGLGEGPAVEGLRPRYPFHVVGQDVAVLAHELPGSRHGLPGGVVDEAGEPHAKTPPACELLGRAVVGRLRRGAAQDDEDLIRAFLSGELLRPLSPGCGEAQLQGVPFDRVDAWLGSTFALRGGIDFAGSLRGIEAIVSLLDSSVRQPEDLLAAREHKLGAFDPWHGLSGQLDRNDRPASLNRHGIAAAQTGPPNTARRVAMQAMSSDRVM